MSELVASVNDYMYLYAYVIVVLVLPRDLVLPRILDNRTTFSHLCHQPNINVPRR